MLDFIFLFFCFFFLVVVVVGWFVEGQQSYIVAMTVLSVFCGENVRTRSIPTICCYSCAQQMCASKSIRCS